MSIYEVREDFEKGIAPNKSLSRSDDERRRIGSTAGV